MKDSDLLWERVQRALDERRDPREDEDVLDAIVEDPEALARMETWLARLESARSLHRRQPVLRLALAASLIALACIPIAWIALRKPAAAVNACEVIFVEWELSTECPAQHTRTVITDREEIARAEFHDAEMNTTWSTESSQRLRP